MNRLLFPIHSAASRWKRRAARAIRAFGFIAALSAQAIAGEEVPPPPADAACAPYGPDFVTVGSGFCARTWGSLIGYAYKEFTDKDITLVGQRIPAPTPNGAGVPIAYYFLDDVRDKTQNPGFGVIASANLFIKRNIDLGSFTAFVRLTLDASSSYDDDGHVNIGLRAAEDSYYYGALDEAWVQIDGLKIGVQPSLFGFNRLPSVVTPGYTSIVTTPAISYTYGFSANASLSISVEDGGRRLFGDGVLARPSRSDIPDVVTLLRFRTPSTLFHFSGALHESEDHVVKDFAGGDPQDVLGGAWSAGIPASSGAITSVRRPRASMAASV